MGGIVTILATLARVLAIITIVSATVAAQSGHDLKEVGHIRPTGMVAFALWAAFGAWISSHGNWLATAFIIGLSAVGSAKIFKFNRRADNFMVVIFGAFMLHVAAPAFSIRPIAWNGWNTLVTIVMIIGLAAVIISDKKQRVNNATAVSHSGSSQKNPWSTITAFAACLSLACVVALSILVA